MTFPSSLQNLTLVMINLAIFWGSILSIPLEHVLVHMHHTPAQTHRPFNPPDLFILFLQGNQVSSEWSGASNGFGRCGRVNVYYVYIYIGICDEIVQVVFRGNEERQTIRPAGVDGR
jgi:hypothetical protein